MKKHFLPICSLFCIAIASGYNVYQSQSKVPMSDIIKANIEALSSGEEGTAAPRCYIKQGGNYGSLNQLAYFCNDKTNDEMIYPCPEYPEFGYYDENKKDRCTK